MAGRPSTDGQRGPCGWVGPDGEFCHNYGPMVKGLCAAHYAGLTASLRAQGLSRWGRPLPQSYCLCPEPQLEDAVLFGGVRVAGAVQCRTCGRGPRPSGSVQE